MCRPLPPLLLGWALLAACQQAPQTGWLQLEEVSPSSLRPGQRLEISGRGFETGQPYRVRLLGHSHRPGAMRRGVSLELTGRALSGERVQVSLGPKDFARLGLGGTFTGELQLQAQPGPDGQGGGPAGSLSPLRLDLLAPAHLALSQRREHHHQAATLLAAMGARAAPVDPSRSGLRLEVVDPLGRAHAAGLRVGDRIVRRDELSVRALADLAPPPGADQLQLWVRRPRHLAAQAVELSLVGLTTPRLEPSRLRLVGALIFALLGSLLLLPRASVATWLARFRSRMRHAPPLPRPSLPQRLLHGGLLVALALLAARQPTLAQGAAAQGPLPWHWGLFQQPALFLLFPVYLAAAARLLPVVSQRVAPLRRMREVAAVLAAAAGATLFLGGLPHTGVQLADSLDPGAVALSLFVLKAWLLLALLRLVRRGTLAPWRSAASWRPALGWLALAALVGLVWSALDPSAAARLSLGHVLFWTSSGLFAISLLRVRRSSAPMGRLLAS